MDGPTPTAWDELELEAKAVPEGDALSIRFRFDPKGPPPHTSVRALPLRRDEDLETQVVRHLEQQRASPGTWELRLMVNNRFRAQRIVRAEFPPPPPVVQDLQPPPPAGSPGSAPPAVMLTGPLSGAEFLRHAAQYIENAEQLKQQLRGALEIEDEEEEEEEEDAPPPPDPFWVQAIKSEKADLAFGRVANFMDGWFDAKLEEQRYKTAIARARAEQLGVVQPEQRTEPQVRLHSVNGEPPKKAEG